jgi:radical SAM protein with 4Fe4S-binding SPASM domain
MTAKPDEMKALVMAGVQVQIPITKENHCDKCDHWDICEGCPYTDERTEGGAR